MRVTAKCPETGRESEWQCWPDGLANLVYALSLYGWLNIEIHEKGTP